MTDCLDTSLDEDFSFIGYDSPSAGTMCTVSWLLRRKDAVT